MIVYKKVPVFNRNTGKQEDDYAEDYYVCDMTGVKLDDWDNYHPTITFNYHDQDPCMGCDSKEGELKKLIGSDFYAFMLQPYHFLRNVENGGCVDWKVILNQWETGEVALDEILRTKRCETALDLIEHGLAVELLSPPFVSGDW